jgi:3-dehydro-L-gulonate 2-dehydrogenase
MTLRIPYPEVLVTLQRLFVKNGFTPTDAEACALLFAKASLEGVPSHGLERVAVFLDMVKNKHVNPAAKLSLLGQFGSFERWSGNLGPGPLNAQFCMERAINLSKEFGIGLVAIQHTNHWMRAGNYGWKAAEAGVIGICWTNTKPNMPAWGGSEPKLGNNPLVVGIPRKEGHIVLDMAMSQFSYGKMKQYLRDGRPMPYEGGFDSRGNLTKDPKEVIEGELALPIGLWKGAGFSLVLDMLAALLSGGNAVHQIGGTGSEFGLSQVFLCLDPRKLGFADSIDSVLGDILEDFLSSETFAGNAIRYPGQNILEIRAKNLAEGVPVEEGVWQGILDRLCMDNEQ